MLGAPVDKAVFSRQSVRAMSPMAQEIAAMLEAADFIKIVDDTEASR